MGDALQMKTSGGVSFRCLCTRCFIGSRCATDRENREWELKKIRALRDLAEIVLDEIALRLKMAGSRAKEKREHEFNDKIEV